MMLSFKDSQLPIERKFIAIFDQRKINYKILMSFKLLAIKWPFRNHSLDIKLRSILIEK